MSTPGRPKGEYRSAKREGSLLSAAGPSQGANCSLSEGRREAPRVRY